VCYNRGYGKVFYFQPGHETYPVYYNENVKKILRNAARWAKPDFIGELQALEGIHIPVPYEAI